MFALDSSFLDVRAVLRSTHICALLVFGHVLLVTMAVAPRELMEIHPDLSSSVKALSGMIFLTLLIKVFVLFELFEPHHPQTHRVGGTSEQEKGQEGDEEGPESHRGRYDLFAMTGAEVFFGTMTVCGWAYCISHAITVSEIFSARVVNELVLIPISFTIALFTLFAEYTQLIVRVGLLFAPGGTSYRAIWTARTGHWEARIQLGEKEVV